MNLLDIFQSYDISGSSFNGTEYVNEINKLSDIERQKDECRFECLAFMLQPNDNEHTFGGYYGPQSTLSDSQGVPVYVPSQSLITPDAVLYWEQRYKIAQNPFMKMRYAGLVWDFKIS